MKFSTRYHRCMGTSCAWDAERYEGKHSYVWQFGAGLVDVLAPREGEHILDIGCGTGQLTAEIAGRGAHVVGLDSSTNMLGQARQNYPGQSFVLADATNFRFPEPFDAVFSNAALHWVRDAEAAVECIARALRPSGRFVAEFGGKGNIASIMSALSAVFGVEADQRCPWFYPSIGEYAPLLERHRLEVREARLFDRPTPVEGEDGMENWLQMFCGRYFEGLTAERTQEKIREITAILRPGCYHDGNWTVDYRRLRVVAVKT
jgi:SAM-dependent methyltransferase